MTITINDEVCKQYGLTLPEVLAITLVKTGVDIPNLYTGLEDKKALVRNSIGLGYLVTLGYAERVDGVLLDSDTTREPQDRIELLATQMMELFPAMKKAGSSQYFRGNRKDITLRLKKFFKLYGNKFSNEQLLAATDKYVKSFNGNYTYMRVLKYFIWKDEKKLDSDGVGYIDEVSDLASYIENNGVEFNTEWAANIR